MTLSEFVHVAQRSIAYLVAIPVLAAAVALIHTHRMPPAYEAYAFVHPHDGVTPERMRSPLPLGDGDRISIYMEGSSAKLVAFSSEPETASEFLRSSIALMAATPAVEDAIELTDELQRITSRLPSVERRAGELILSGSLTGPEAIVELNQMTDRIAEIKRLLGQKIIREHSGEIYEYRRATPYWQAGIGGALAGLFIAVLVMAIREHRRANPQ